MDNINEVQAVEEESGLKAHADRLLNEVKTWKGKARELEVQVTELQKCSDGYKNAYIDLMRNNLVNDVMTKANVTDAGKAMVAAHISQFISVNNNDESLAVVLNGYEDADQLAKAIQENDSFKVAIQSNMGGAFVQSVTTVTNNAESTPSANQFGLGR